MQRRVPSEVRIKKIITTSSKTNGLGEGNRVIEASGHFYDLLSIKSFDSLRCKCIGCKAQSELPMFSPLNA
jgi:hypothetical protein